MTDDPLILPTDKEIINLLATGHRQTPANVAAHLGMKNKYASERLRNLRDRGYLHDPGPADRSGMYQITDLGRIVAWHSPTYVRSKHSTFARIAQTIHDNQPDTGFYPDLVYLIDDYRSAIIELNKRDGLVIPSEFSLPQSLYALHVHGLAERKDEMDVYDITGLGERVADLCADDTPGPMKLTEIARETYSEEEHRILNTLTSNRELMRLDADSPGLRDLS